MRKLISLTLLAGLVLPNVSFALGKPKEFDEFGFRKRHAQRAAPWFLYWPYEAYWQTPAPTGAVPPSPLPMSYGNFAQQYQQFSAPGGHPGPGHAPAPGHAPYPIYPTANGYGN
jgi:hypothetical protein